MSLQDVSVFFGGIHYNWDMLSTAFKQLKLDSTMNELPIFSDSIAPDEQGEHLIEMFNQKEELPGVLVAVDETHYSVISRRFFFERLGKLYGTEIFMNRPVRELLEYKKTPTLRIPSATKISHAANLILNRQETEVFEPIIVEREGKRYGVIAPLTVFMAQNAILAKVHNHQLTVDLQSMNLSDVDALEILNAYVNPEERFTLTQIQEKHRVYCTSCMCLNKYSVADVVRDYPDISKGVRVEVKRGRLVLVMKVKHQCSDALWEIEVEHNPDLSFRRQEAVQLVESYIL